MLAHNKFINYSSLGLDYVLLKSETLYNRGLTAHLGPVQRLQRRSAKELVYYARLKSQRYYPICLFWAQSSEQPPKPRFDAILYNPESHVLWASSTENPESAAKDVPQKRHYCDWQVSGYWKAPSLSGRDKSLQVYEDVESIYDLYAWD